MSDPHPTLVDQVSDQVVVLVARDRSPGSDLVTSLVSATGYAPAVCQAAVFRAHASGYLEFDTSSENLPVHGRPTEAGIALLAAGITVRRGEGNAGDDPSSA